MVARERENPMLRIVLGIFMVLHGLVHLLYYGQSRGLFELQRGMVWPEGAWAFSRLLGDGTARRLASAACIVAAVGFVAGGTGILAGQAWWRPAVVGAAAFSTVIFALFWDGSLHRLDNQGAIAILINAAILIAVLILHWPAFGF
jgi:uncharacterized membrane protein YphA (DoxX/SURF4 family)